MDGVCRKKALNQCVDRGDVGPGVLRLVNPVQARLDKNLVASKL